MLMGLQAGLLLLLLCTGGSQAARCELRGREGDVLPKPSWRQLQFQRADLQMMTHFGVNTYTDREWGLGNEDPNIFQPVRLNTTQWVEAAKDAGFTEIVMIAKHHDGFFLYPNPYTNHSVQGSSWRDHKGDVVKDFVASCASLGVTPAFYLSPWDRNYYNMTWKPSYNDFYHKTFEVLATKYGQFKQLWWDGANAVPNRTHLYNWKDWLDLLRTHQPDAVGGGCGGIAGVPFDCGPDTAWIGNEKGMAPETLWSWHNASIEFPNMTSPTWGPYFCDVSIRPGWFWHEKENNKLKTLSQLADIYIASAGSNCVLQLNVPPNRDGLLEDGDVHRLQELGQWIRKSFGSNLLAGGAATASSTQCGSDPNMVLDGSVDTYWIPEVGVSAASLQVALKTPATADAVMLMEHIADGQAISQFVVKVKVGGKWQEVASSTTIGHRKILKFPRAIESITDVQIEIQKTAGDVQPELEYVGLHKLASTA